MRVEFAREYLNWIDGLSGLVGRLRILSRVQRLIDGNPGSHRHLGKEVFELKIDVGPGYRVYYSLLGASHLILLIGGDKSTQTRDITKAMELSRQYPER